MTQHKTKHNSKILKRVFGGLPVVDAKRELRVFVAKYDIKPAKRKDPTNCVFAKACRRLYGSRIVAFFRTVVYMELPDNKGNLRIERFRPSRPTERSIARFDRTGKADPAGYHLLPPSPGKTMDHQLEIARKYQAATKHGTPASKKGTGPKKKIIAEVRNGKGLVKFLDGTKENWTRSA